MKRLFLSAVLAIAALSAGCASAQTASPASAAPSTVNPLDPGKVVSDLKNAQQIATAAGVTQDAACYGAQVSWVQSVAGNVPLTAGAALPAATGPAGEFELARLKVKQVQTFDTAIKQAIVAGVPDAVHNACAPMWLDIRNDAAKVALILGIANPSGALGILGAANAALPIPLR